MVYSFSQGIIKKRMGSMALFLIALGLGLSIAVATMLASSSANANSHCNAVSTSKGNLTAAQVGGDVSGEIDASGCDIGAYFNSANPGSVTGAQIHDANQYGVFVDGNVAGNVNVDVLSSEVYNIGNHSGGVFAPNGSQTGVGIYYVAYLSPGTVSGQVKANQVSDWQKGGIVCNGDAECTVENNNVGESASNKTYLAPNGIQIGYGALGTIQHNNIEGSSWCGPSNYAAAAILLYEQQDGTVVKQNNISGDSDVGIYAYGGVTEINNNKVFEDKNAVDCNTNGYDWGIGNWGDPASEVTNNKVKGFDTAYEGVAGGKNKTIPGPQKSNPSF